MSPQYNLAGARTLSLVPDPSRAREIGPPSSPLLSHFYNNCVNCYSCEWFKYARLSHVPHPTFAGRKVRNVRRQMITEHCRYLEPAENIQKDKAMISYVYPKKVDGRPRWVVVPCKPLVPYLLNEDATSGIESFVFLSSGYWAGLKASGPYLQIHKNDRPPMRNELYKMFGYGPFISPYLPYGDPAYGDCRACRLWWNGLVTQPPHVANGVAPLGHQLQPAGAGAVAVDDDDFNPRNTTVFVGCLPREATEERLKGIFGGFGEIAAININRPKANPALPFNNAFVYFYYRCDAEMAITHRQGFKMGNIRLRLSWGKAQNIGQQPMYPFVGDW